MEQNKLELKEANKAKLFAVLSETDPSITSLNQTVDVDYYTVKKYGLLKEDVTPEGEEPKEETAYDTIEDAKEAMQTILDDMFNKLLATNNKMTENTGVMYQTAIQEKFNQLFTFTSAKFNPKVF